MRSDGARCPAPWSMRPCRRGVSLSTPEDSERAQLLARKASEDAKAAQLLADNDEIADEIVGFHAQQAVEKWLKAVIAARGLPEARIHDIGRLRRSSG